jgi:sugar phosphate isomerase/epimerase
MSAVKFPVLRIGNQTAYSAGSVMEPFEFALANDFRCFEFFPDRGHAGIGGWAEDDLVAATRRWIRESAAAKDLELTVHAPLEFNPLHDPCHPRLESTVRFSQDIGATLVNLHLDATQGAEAFVEALRPTLEMTAQAGLKLAIENTVWTGPEDFNDFFAALRARTDLPGDHAGMCLDLGHANLAGAYRNDFLGFVDALSPELPITHLHLHENWGDRDSHLALFTGPSRDNPAGLAGLLKRLARRRFQGCAILEQWPHPPWQLVEARERLEGMMREG